MEGSDLHDRWYFGVRCAIVSGLGNTRRLIEAMHRKEVAYDFIEVMACPGGCSGGGGQPIHEGSELAAERAAALYQLDGHCQLRFSHENPTVQALYREFLEKPLSPLAETAAAYRSHILADAKTKNDPARIDDKTITKVPGEHVGHLFGRGSDRVIGMADPAGNHAIASSEKGGRLMAQHWTQEQIDHEKQILTNQLMTKSGRFAIFVLRTYRYIAWECQNNHSNWCYADRISGRHLLAYVYNGPAGPHGTRSGGRRKGQAEKDGVYRLSKGRRALEALYKKRDRLLRYPSVCCGYAGGS